ncbi:MAG: glycerophosphodiester phosphodiesterase [Paenibacillus sp.]|jgi:glycerophosphoryl diester phosphodiesterase|nr:glycerophosphodiester phosphodiesterase [Paenibacillus sp.]
MLKMIQGHRGSSEHYPENTLLSFKKAIEEGANAIEMDIKKTADGEFIVMHDKTVDRTTGGTGLVNELDSAYILGLDAGAWKGAEFANRPDTKVPRLADILDYFRGADVFLILQPSFANEEDHLAMYEMVADRSMIHQVVFFGGPGLKRIKQINPNAYCHNDGMPDLTKYAHVLTRAVQDSLDAVSVHANAGGMEQIVSHVHREGKAVHISYLTRQYEEQATRLIDLGVEFILGNDCAAMMEVVRRKGLTLAIP